MAKLSLTKLWMMSHPDDVPPPRSPHAAAAWRRKRFINVRTEAEREKYERAMTEMKERSATGRKQERGGKRRLG